MARILAYTTPSRGHLFHAMLKRGRPRTPSTVSTGISANFYGNANPSVSSSVWRVDSSLSRPQHVTRPTVVPRAV